MAVSTDPANNIADIALGTQQSIVSPTVSFGWTPYPSRPASEAKSRHLSLDVKIGSSDFNANHRAGPVPGPNALRNDRAICVDFDEVFASSMLALIVAHNQQYGTDFTMDDLEFYYLFQNRGWGKPSAAQAKVSAMGDLLARAPAVAGLVPALKRLRQLGHPIHIVTARGKSDESSIIRWLAEHSISIGERSDDLVQSLHLLGSWDAIEKTVQHVSDGQNASKSQAEADMAKHEAVLIQAYKNALGANQGALAKLEVVRKLGASLLIDDHFGNLEPITQASGARPECLLFGPYRWNKRRSGLSAGVDFMSFEERLAADIKDYGEDVELVDGIERTETWEDVVAWVERWDRLELLKQTGGRR